MQATSCSTTDRSPNVPPHKRNIGMVFQSYALFPHMTVAREHRVSRCACARLPKAEIGRRVAKCSIWSRLEDFGEPLPAPALRRPAAARGDGAGARFESARCC